MEDYATIIGTRHYLEPFDNYYNTYEWIGKRQQLYLLSDEVVWQDLPWEFIKIKRIPEQAAWLVIRKDALLPFGWFTFVNIKLLNAWKWFYYRLIITANVWGLAYTRQGYIPSWKDLFKKK